MWLSYFHSLYSYLTAPTSPCHDVAIVGGGIVGCSLAYHLSANKQASSIYLIDRESIGSGATGLSAATLYTTLTKTAPPPLLCNSDLTKALDVTQTRALDARLVAETIAMCQSLQEDGYDCGLVQCGGLTVMDVPVTPQLRQDYWDLRRRQHHIQLLTPRQVQEREPLVRAESNMWAFHTPLSGYVDPMQTVHAFMQAALDTGKVTLTEHTEVVELIPSNNHTGPHTLVLNNGSKVRAHTVLLCTGTGGQHLLHNILEPSDTIPDEYHITPVEGTMWTMSSQGAKPLSHIIYTTGSNEYWRDNTTTPPRCTHLNNGHTLTNHLYGRPSATSDIDDGGAHFGAGRMPPFSVPLKHRHVEQHALIQKGIQTVESTFDLVADGDLDDDSLPKWSGHMPFSSTGRPIVREMHPGVWMVNGFGPKGIMLGPAVASWLATTLQVTSNKTDTE